MKKLMMAAAIVCAAAYAQAATFTWSTGDSIYALDDSVVAAGLAAGTTYGADGADIDTAGWTGGVTYTLLLSYGSETDTLKGTLGTDEFSGAIYTEGLESALVDQDDRTVDYSYTLTYTLTDGQGKEWVLASDTIEGQQFFSSSGDAILTSDATTTWSTAAVPEPTSGLLLLLGVAGLALKRKRA